MSLADEMRKAKEREAENWRQPKATSTGKKKTSSQKPKKDKKKVVTLEIDFDWFEYYICNNHDVEKGQLKEHQIFERVFKPYKKGRGMSTRGRDAWLWDAIKDLMTKKAEMIVKKVTREEVI